MFCPNCGVQIVETTKYCKSCGIPLTPVVDFVASGGTSPIGGASPWSGAFSGFSPSQKMWLIILTLIFSPILLGALPFFVPIAIVWMILRHNEQKRFRGVPTAIPPGYYQQPPHTNPLFGVQQQPPPVLPPPVMQTGSLSSKGPGSIVEEDTRRFQK